MSDLTNAASTQHVHVTDPPAYVFFGVRMVIHLSGEQTRGNFSLIEAFMPPGGDGGLHLHVNEDETLNLLAGELEVTVADQIFTLKTGETCFIPRNTPHRLKNKSGVEVRAILVNTPGTFDPFIKIAGIPAEIAAHSVPAPPTPEQMEQLLILAEKFGIKMILLPGMEA